MYNNVTSYIELQMQKYLFLESTLERERSNH